MTQPYFTAMTPETQRREKIRKRVRQTSVAAYADGRERFTGRKANVLRWLAAYYNRFQDWPTSAELAAEIDEHGYEGGNWTAHVLYMRRGLSDLQTSAVVEANGKRTCDVTGRVCETWRVTPLGRSRTTGAQG